MVLETSATPYIFTFKLWDWGRPGLDGRPRPIHLEHGCRNIQWDRDTKWVARNLMNRTERMAEGDGWIEEKTGLQELEFIETRRHWFTTAVEPNPRGEVNVLNLVEGKRLSLRALPSTSNLSTCITPKPSLCRRAPDPIQCAPPKPAADVRQCGRL